MFKEIAKRKLYSRSSSLMFREGLLATYNNLYFSALVLSERAMLELTIQTQFLK